MDPYRIGFIGQHGKGCGGPCYLPGYCSWCGAWLSKADYTRRLGCLNDDGSWRGTHVEDSK